MVRSKVTKDININPETLSGKSCSEHNIFQFWSCTSATLSAHHGNTPKDGARI